MQRRGKFFYLVICLGRNRDALDIVADILQVANPFANKTKIMFKANLSFNLLQKYLKKVVDAQLLSFEDGKYNVTSNGRDFLEQYNDIQDRYIETQKMMENLDNQREKLERLYQQLWHLR